MAVKGASFSVTLRPSFLSRLCGGEETSVTAIETETFLSRLCGGEGDSDLAFSHQRFLSRLCGGEEIVPAVCSMF